MLQWVEKDEEFVWRRSSVLRKSRDPAWVDARWTRACWGQTGDSETRCFSEVELVCFSFSPLHLIKVWLTERWRENVQKWWHELPPKDLETAPVRQLLYLGVNSSDPSLLPHVKKKKPDVTTSVLWFRAPDCLPCWEPSHTIRLGIIQKKAECVLVFFLSSLRVAAAPAVISS